jgi:hypothetical protein
VAQQGVVGDQSWRMRSGAQWECQQCQRFWYFFAVADDGARWEGEFQTFVKDPESFDLCNGLGSTALPQFGFRELDIGDSDNYALTFLA